eukprot:GILK01021398.1.p1 GENE.GILK01021398.1~~GILK01021398.1.p1  ORF type:complete len:185 (-),score=7.37 GILK01021398.1:136-690(-)
MACINGSEKSLQLLLDNGSDLFATTEHGETALHAAAREGPYGVKILLSESEHAFVDVRTNGLRTPLHVSATNGRHEVSSLLIACGADIEARDGVSWSPLHHAAEAGSYQDMRILLQNGADVDSLTVSLATPLVFASVSPHPLQSLQILLDSGADIRRNLVEVIREHQLGAMSYVAKRILWAEGM